MIRAMRVRAVGVVFVLLASVRLLSAQTPDPTNPRLVNASFEEEPNFKSEGGQPGWYYERLVTRREDDKSPDGKHYIEFKNQVANLDGHLLQGFPIDGRKVPQSVGYASA